MSASAERTQARATGTDAKRRAKCHVRGCTNEAADGLPCCWACADHVCTKKCLRRDGGAYYCNRVEPVVVVLERSTRR